MLRNIVLLFGAFLLAGGAIGLALHAGPAMLSPLCLGALLLLGTIFEPHYRRNQPTLPQTGNWERSGETFHDPETGGIVEVWTNKENGERRYVLPRK